MRRCSCCNGVGVYSNVSDDFQSGILPDKSRCLKANKADACVAYVFVDMTIGGGITATDKARCLQSRYAKGAQKHTAEMSGVGVMIGNTNPSGNGMNGCVFDIDKESPTLTTNKGEGYKIAIPVITQDRSEKRQNGRRFKDNGEDAFTLTAQDRHGVAIDVDVAAKEHNGVYVQMPNGAIGYAIWYEKEQCYITIRKLTPRECFRLQGWTDDYFEKAQFVNSDSQLYKQAGNGVTVSVVQAVGESIADAERRLRAHGLD